MQTEMNLKKEAEGKLITFKRLLYERTSMIGELEDIVFKNRSKKHILRDKIKYSGENKQNAIDGNIYIYINILETKKHEEKIVEINKELEEINMKLFNMKKERDSLKHDINQLKDIQSALNKKIDEKGAIR